MIDAALHKTVFLTGATGFVGSHLTRRLLSDGWDIHIIALPNDNFTLLRGIQDRIHVHTHDGSTEGLRTIVENARPDIAIHLASIFISQHEPKDLVPLITSNILFGTQLVNALTEQGCGRFINTGSSWQHFENLAYNPVNLYAATKQAFEDMLLYYVESSQIKAITLKLFDTYGPDDPRPKLFTLLRTVAKEQKELAMSPGEQIIDLVYIDDIVEAFVLATERLMKDNAARYESYAVSSGNPIKLRELVNTYASVIKKDLPIKWGARPYRFREVMVPWASGKTVPGWRPRIGLEEGIRLMEHLHYEQR